MVVWGQVKSESSSLPVTVRVSKTRVLKFPTKSTVTGVLLRGVELYDLVKTAFCFCLRRRRLRSGEKKVVGVASRSRRNLNHKAWARAFVVIAFRFDLLTTPSTMMSSWFSLDRGTQREILRKRPKHNNKAWKKLSEAILSIFGDCWKKFICSSLPARQKEEFPASKVYILNLQPDLLGSFPADILYVKKNCFLPMKHLRVHMNSFERIRAFKIELEFGSVSFWGEGKTGETGEKPLGARKKTNNKLNPHLVSTPGFEPGPRWWEASALTTAPSLPPKTLLVQTLLASLDVVIGQNSALQWW